MEKKKYNFIKISLKKFLFASFVKEDSFTKSSSIDFHFDFDRKRTKIIPYYED